MTDRRAEYYRGLIVSNLIDLYFNAKHFYLTSKEISDRYNKIIAALPKNHPQWLISYAPII